MESRYLAEEGSAAMQTYMTAHGGENATAAAPASSSADNKSQEKKSEKQEKKAPKEEKRDEKEDEDDLDDDLFGDDDDDDDEAALEAAKKKAEEAKAKAKSKQRVQKTQCVFDVKPWEADTDLNELMTKIRGIEMDGLVWGVQHKLEPVAFGIKKLVFSCVIEDDKVSLDDITEAIEAFEDYVQSVDLASMNKV